MGLDRTEIAAQLRADITSGKYKIGEKLPSYRQLATMFGAAPNTVGEAVRLLAGEGLVAVKPNSRASVRSPSDETPSSEERLALTRNELADVQSELRQVRTQLNALDQRVSSLLSQLDE